MGQTVKHAFADLGYAGDGAAQAARDDGIELQVVKLSEAKKGFVRLPRRWVVERSIEVQNTVLSENGKKYRISLN